MSNITIAETMTAMRDALLDPSGERYKDAELLGAINTAGRQLNPIVLRIDPRVLRRTWDISYVTSTSTYAIPSRAGRILAVTRLATDGSIDYDMLPLQADELAGEARQAREDWYLLGDGTIQIDATPSASQTTAVRIHYAPGWVPVHTGFASAGASGTITLATNATLGTVLTADDVYVGGRIRLTNNLPAGVLGLERTITDSTTAKVCTVDTAWSTTPTTATSYEIEMNLPDLAQQALIWSACRILAAIKDKENFEYFDGERREAINAMTAALNTYLPRDTGGASPKVGMLQ